MHGESLGGCVAAHIARACNPDFAFVDRSFASLTAIAHWGFGGRTASRFFWALTGWGEQCWLNYRDATQGYKLLGCDANDTMVIDMASVKTAMATAFAKPPSSTVVAALRGAVGPLCEMIGDFECRAKHQPLFR